MKKLFTHIIFAGSLVALLILIGCSREKAGFTNRLYHNTTSHFNGYFNAMELMGQIRTQLWENKEDDYLELLPVYVLPQEEAVEGISGQMDVIIEKTSRVIDRHSMDIRKTEYNKWIDDNFLLMGQAYFYKGQYATAEEMFDYVTKKYKTGEARFMAAIWLARTYMQQERFGKASTVLSVASEMKGNDRPEEFDAALARVYAALYLQQERYQEAIPHLENAALLTKDKQIKSRMTYILAQVYQLQNESQKAIDTYAKVVDMRPDYEMEFYAKISQALAYNRRLDSGKIKAMLLDMAKDEKNDEYYDQIYYALAEIELEERNDSLGIEYLLLSARKSVNNPKQKGKTYLKLADLHFQQRKYLEAKNYYDSTAAFLPEDYPDYAAIKLKGQSLQALVSNLETIHLQDSLLALANMEPKDREKEIAAMMAELEAQKEQQEQQRLRAIAQMQMQSSQTQANAGSGRNWYFYNPATLSSGFQSFKQTWGDRPLEDNWRRKSRRSTGTFADVAEIAGDSSVAAVPTETSKTLEEYLAELPQTEAEIKAAHNKIIPALYQVGLIYKERLDDPDNAIEPFLRLTNDYDTSEVALTAYYQLYRIYLNKEQKGGFVGTGFRDNSEYYKNVILGDYPNSEYAKIILDPDYIAGKNARYQQEKEQYEETFKKYNRRQYSDVLVTCNTVIRDEPENNFLAKYYFIKAMTIATQNSPEAYENILREIVTKFPKTEEGEKARELLRLLNEAKAQQQRQNGQTVQTEDPVQMDPADKPAPTAPANSMFEVNPTSDHFFALVFPKEGTASADLKAAVSAYNEANFAGEGLRITNSFIDKDHQILIVRSFSDKETALAYYRAFAQNQDQLKAINEAGYPTFVITTKNFTTLFRNKNTNVYLEFFAQNYLN